jgi:hypothetical protein
MREFKVIFSVAFLFTVLVPLTHFEICSLRYASINAQTIDQCTQQLISAEEEYQLRKWNESIKSIEKCLTKPNLSEIEKGKAYRILSLVYIAIQSEKEANKAVKNLLIMVPNYKIHPDKDPPALQKYIDDITHTLTPEISFIVPISKDQNGDGFTMSVQGSNFVYGSEVMINGKGRATTFISDTLLLAQFSRNDLLIDDEYEITVHNPILNGRISNPKKFVVKSSSISVWEWFALGTVAITLVVTAINLLKPDPEPRPIAEPPARP